MKHLMLWFATLGLLTSLLSAQQQVIMVPRAASAANHPPILSVGAKIQPVITRPLRELAAVNLPQPRPQPVNLPRFMVQPAEASIASAQTVFFPPINTAANIPPAGLAASIGLSFDGVGLGLAGLGNPPFGVNFDPPDPSGAVGLTQYVQWVNASYAVFRKADGLLVMGPVSGNTLWAPLGGPCSQFNTGDPIVLYDKLASRWVLSQLAVVDPAIGPFFECIAVSRTSDATGAYSLYQQQFVQDPNNPPSTTNPPIFNDFPKFGIMPDAYYASYNTFTKAQAGASATGERACAYDRNAMLNGDPIIPICFQLPFVSLSIDNTLVPADLDGTTLPPSGTPGYFLGMDFSTSSILLYRFHVDFTTPLNSTFDSINSALALPPNQPGVDNFSAVCTGLGENCITQPGTTNTLSAVSDRSGYRFAYRNFGDHEAFVLTHTVEGAFQDTNEPTDVAWWELRKTGAANPVIFQSHDNFDRVAGPGANINRWLGSVAMDKTGNMLLGYSISAGNDLNDSTVQIHPSIGLQGRSRTDAVGTTTALNAGEVVMTGNGSIIGAGGSRWGDYSQMTVDPVDDCTFWYTNEYISADTSAPQWSTRILSVKFPTCVATPDFSISATPTGSVIPGTSTTYAVSVAAMAGFTGTVALSTSGLPTGVTGTFNPTTVSGGGTSTLTVSAATTTSAGDFSFNITGTSGTTTLTGAPGAISHSSTVTMAVNDFSLSGTPTTRKIAPGNAGTFTIGLAWLKDFGESVTLSIAGQPPLSQVSFSPGTITQSTSSTLTITTDPSTALGDYPLTITGTHASGAQRTVIVHLDLTNFTASASPTSQSTTQGGSTSYTVSLADVGGFGFSDPVTLSLNPATLPAGVQGTFSPNPVAGLGSSTLTVTTTSSTPQGAATLTIKATDGNLVHNTSVGLTVGPVPVAACVSPNSLTFTGQNVGTTSTAQIVTLTSCGTSTLAISTISASGDFSQTNNCPASLAANANCAINVTFRPTTTGSRTGTLSIVDNATTSPQSISLAGTGTTPAVGLSPTSLTFVAQNIGSTSAAQTVTLNNSGTGPLSITSIVATGDFAQTNNCGTTLVVNGSCTINVSFTPTATGTRSGTLSVNDNAAGSPQSIALMGTGKIPGLNFVPVTPCRIADTRNPNGPFGGPFLSGGAPGRAFTIPNSACNIPSTAQAYSLNLTVVPHGPLGYLEMFPCGQAQPATSTLNSIDGRVKAQAAIVQAGTGGAVCAFAANDTDLILDINGYFVSATTPSTLAFYPVTPCRIVDTQAAAGPLGGPFLPGNTVRSFPLLSGSCGVPSTAQAYSLNYTVVPEASTFGFLTTWPTGQTQPLVSTLNDPTNIVIANAAIVQAGTNGSISVFVTNDSHLKIDINGYFAPPAAGGLSLFNLAQCRVLDTRNPAGSPPFLGQLDVNVQASPCGVPAAAQSYVLNATVIPTGGLRDLDLWTQGATDPALHLLWDGDGSVASNMAIVTTTNGSVSVFVPPPSQTHLLLDIWGYFAP